MPRSDKKMKKDLRRAAGVCMYMLALSTTIVVLLLLPASSAIFDFLRCTVAQPHDSIYIYANLLFPFFLAATKYMKKKGISSLVDHATNNNILLIHSRAYAPAHGTHIINDVIFCRLCDLEKPVEPDERFSARFQCVPLQPMVARG